MRYRAEGNVLYLCRQPFHLFEFEYFMLGLLGRGANQNIEDPEHNRSVWAYVPVNDSDKVTSGETIQEIIHFLDLHELKDYTVSFGPVGYMPDAGSVLEVVVSW